MNSKQKILVILSLSALLNSLPAFATAVLVAHPITAGIAGALLQDSEVEILSAVPATLPAARQWHYLEHRGKDKLAQLSRRADAAITVKSISPADYLYPLARRSNIRIVPIDIASPIDGAQSGVAKRTLDLAEHPVWLNPAALATMLNIFSNEITALDEQSQAVVAKNLAREQQRLGEIVNQMQAVLTEIPVDPVILLTDPGLNYFVQGLQIPADTAATETLTPERLAKEINSRGINLLITDKALPEALQAILQAANVQVFMIDRLKPTDPVGQLGAQYAAFARVLHTLNQG